MWNRLRESGRAHADDIVVQREQIVENDRRRAPVENGVVEAPNHPPLIAGEAKRGRARERRTIERHAAFAIGRDVGMSRSQLHRKLTALTGQSASEFIRKLRLKRAEELIRKQYGHTAEVAYQVGFNSVSYFIKCFKEVYGKTPTELGAISRDEMVNQ